MATLLLNLVKNEKFREKSETWRSSSKFFFSSSTMSNIVASTWCRRCKTFYGRYLQVFVIHGGNLQVFVINSRNLQAFVTS